MKEIDLERSIRESAKYNRELKLNEGERTRRNHPMCAKCNKEIDCAELVNVNSKSCEIRAICDHGTGVDEEDFYKVYWKVPVSAVGNDILEDPNVGWAINRALGDALFFRPDHNFDFSSKR